MQIFWFRRKCDFLFFFLCFLLYGKYSQKGIITDNNGTKTIFANLITLDGRLAGGMSGWKEGGVNDISWLARSEVNNNWNKWQRLKVQHAVHLVIDDNPKKERKHCAQLLLLIHLHILICKSYANSSYRLFPFHSRWSADIGAIARLINESIQLKVVTFLG